HLAPIARAEARIVRAQLFRRRKWPHPRHQIVHEWRVAGARNVTFPRIDRLPFPAIALGLACVDQKPTVRKNPLAIYDQLGSGPRVKVGRCDLRSLNDEWEALGLPGLDASVQHSTGFVTEIAQQEPQARSNGATGVVVGHHSGRVAYADALHRA